MKKGIRTIKDRNTFDKIIEKFFINKPVYIKTAEGNIKVDFLDSHNALTKIKFPLNAKIPEDCLFLSTYKNNLIYAHMKLCGDEGMNTHLFNPTMFQVISDSRKNVREHVNNNGDQKNIVFVTNIISDFIIQNSLILENEKVARIKEKMQYELGEKYKHVKLYFSHEGMNDARMKYFHTERRPIFISDRLIKKNLRDDNLNFYLRNIYMEDNYLKKRPNIISEIAVPVFYNSMIPYGYIQINDTSPLKIASLKAMKRMAYVVEDLADKLKIFSVFEKKILVYDVSKDGLGIVFKDENLIPHYKENSYVYLDMILPWNKKASILADVKHLVKLDNQTIKVGFGIKDMDNISSMNYNKFLEFTHEPQTVEVR
ncbi:MAG: hypothetical protein GY870_02280 [archaeon]|nr:hypothetical protein [archaeon]